MAFAKIKMVVALALSLAVLGTGAGWLVFRNTTVAAPASAEAKAPGIKLPDDPKAAVITLDYLGGRLRRQREEPVLVIHADGTIKVGDPWGSGGDCESKISPRELQDLLRFIIKDNAFFDFDSAKVQQAVNDEMKKAGLGIKVSDASTVIVRVQADGRDHQARFYALATYATRYKQIKALGQLLVIQSRLDRVKSVAVAGGAEAIAADLKLANESLHKDHPKVAALTLDDLQTVRRTPDGKTTIITFFRNGIPAEKGKDVGFVRVDINRKEKEKPTVGVKVGEQTPGKVTPNK